MKLKTLWAVMFPPGELSKPRPDPPCGYERHYYWVDQEWPCPKCLALERRAQMERDKDALVEDLANRVAKKLKEQP